MKRLHSFASLSIVLALGLITTSIPGRADDGVVRDSLQPTELLPQSSTPEPGVDPSDAAQLAIDYLAEQEGIPVTSLVVATDHSASYPNLERQFQVVTLIDTRPEGLFYNLLVDLDTDEVIEDVASIDAAESNAQFENYGKLQLALYEKLQTLQDTDYVDVAIWVMAPVGESLPEREVQAMAILAAEYPEAQEAVENGGKPMDVDDPVLAETIYWEYVSLVEISATQRVQSLVDYLATLGVSVQTVEGLPVVFASLDKATVSLVEQRDDVGAIYLADGDEQSLSLDSAIPTDRAPAVWARGYDGTGIKIAILEPGNVDFDSPIGSECPIGNNCFLHPGAIRQGSGDSGEDDHATLVASITASSHSTYRGMASGATVLSAGIQEGIIQNNRLYSEQGFHVQKRLIL
jgi:hypothetical protein